MVSETHVAHNVELTAESLQEDLARLHVQKQALERELAAVVAHLGSVERALRALQSLMLDPAVAPAETPVAPGRRQAAARVAPETAVPSPAVPAEAPKTAPRTRRPRSRQGAKESATSTDADRQSGYGRLTEQILEYFATVGDADVRARDVAAALGRDTDSGTINAVRSTLDRLVGTSRIRRTGRGLYRAERA
ncbi:hypothetical protein QRN89_31935 [Streptomyces chengbuensis]|uniref:hypothetical protein n=1 Tax=Streptomyces TaxID=1883 RepID=UPI0025B46A22|nr:hypothetical protein [Streptomyces sp. HUAS CB01]WJY54012.1 hypothetical protein QRN89_31935 [Streptomyces sp. HUAS CB01]